MTISIHPDAETIIQLLRQNGFEAYAVGGCVRDILLGQEPHDWDICTSATPAEMKQCFSAYKTFDTGIAHGTITVVIHHLPFEVTTYRVDGDYKDNRHPESVTFTRSLREDLARRDFTVNAMAYNEESGTVDLFGGEKDLRNKTIRCVGNPDERFNEDALRILRALRFASCYDCAIESAAASAIRGNAELLRNIAVERVAAEFTKLICGGGAERILNDYREVVAVFLPELRETFDFEQRNKHHIFDVYHHITHSVGLIDPTPLLRYTMLLHDIGKPRACTTDQKGARHFKGHQQISAEIALEALRRLRLPNALTEDCLELILCHDVRYSGTKKQLRRLLNRLGEEKTRLLFKVQYADTLSQSEYLREEKLLSLETAKRQFEEIVRERECVTLRQLEINGRDLIGLGITDGKTIGAVLRALLEMVMDEEVENKKAALLELAERLKKADKKSPT